jgi:hypothetical protein
MQVHHETVSIASETMTDDLLSALIDEIRLLQCP